MCAVMIFPPCSPSWPLSCKLHGHARWGKITHSSMALFSVCSSCVWPSAACFWLGYDAWCRGVRVCEIMRRRRRPFFFPSSSLCSCDLTCSLGGCWCAQPLSLRLCGFTEPVTLHPCASIYSPTSGHIKLGIVQMLCQLVVMNCSLIVNFLITHRPFWPSQWRMTSRADWSALISPFLVPVLVVTCYIQSVPRSSITSIGSCTRAHIRLVHAQRHTHTHRQFNMWYYIHTQLCAVPPSDRQRPMWKWVGVEACCLWLLVFRRRFTADVSWPGSSTAAGRECSCVSDLLCVTFGEGEKICRCATLLWCVFFFHSMASNEMQWDNGCVT